MVCYENLCSDHGMIDVWNEISTISPIFYPAPAVSHQSFVNKTAICMMTMHGYFMTLSPTHFHATVSCQDLAHIHVAPFITHQVVPVCFHSFWEKRNTAGLRDKDMHTDVSGRSEWRQWPSTCMSSVEAFVTSINLGIDSLLRPIQNVKETFEPQKSTDQQY